MNQNELCSVDGLVKLIDLVKSLIFLPIIRLCMLVQSRDERICQEAKTF